MIDLNQIKRIIDIEYHDILAGAGTDIYRNKIRVHISDGSFADIWFSERIKDRFSFHWERRHIDGRIYRHDNFPDIRWKKISTYPKHFHSGSQNEVKESSIDDDPISGVREFMSFIRKMILGK